MNSEFGSFDVISLQHHDRARRAPVERTVTHSVPVYEREDSAAISDVDYDSLQALQRLERSLVALNAAFYLDYGRSLNTESLSGLRRFVKAHGLVGSPSIGAESNGQVIASWRNGADTLSLQFLDRFHFHYAIALQEASGIARRWGPAHALTFFDQVDLARRFLAT